jgi:hypothetical protein
LQNIILLGPVYFGCFKITQRTKHNKLYRIPNLGSTKQNKAIVPNLANMNPVLIDSSGVADFITLNNKDMPTNARIYVSRLSPIIVSSNYEVALLYIPVALHMGYITKAKVLMIKY